MRAAALGALIGIFIIAFFFGLEPHKSLATVMPVAPKYTPAADADIININDDSDKIFISKNRLLTVNSDPSAIRKFHCEAQTRREITGQILRFPSGKNEFSKIIMSGGARNSEASSLLNKFPKNPAFDDSGVRIASVDEHIIDGFSNQKNVSQDDAGTMAGNVFFSGEINRFASESRLPIGNGSQNGSEAGDKNRRYGGHKPIVNVYDGDDPRKNIWAEMILGALFLVSILAWTAYLICGGKME